MTATVSLDFFHGSEDRMGSFFRVPKAFEKADLFKTATLEAKYLYSLMLDRVHISARNGWLDAGRVFIYYTLKEVIRTVKVGKNKALQILHELEDLGLILRKKQGQGKPAKIFVRNIIETDAETIPIQNTKDTQNAQNIENAESAETAGNEESIDKASVSGQDTEDMRDTQSAGTEDTNARNEKWDTPVPVSDSTPEPENAASAVDTLDAQASDAESLESPVSISSDNHQDAPVAETEPRTFGDQSARTRSVENSSPRVPAGEPQTSSCGKSGLPSNQTSGLPQNGSAEVCGEDWKYNKMNNKNQNNTDFSYTHPSIIATEPLSAAPAAVTPEERREEMEESRESVRDMISYETLIREFPQDKRIIDGYVEILTETLCSDSDTIRIGQQEYSIHDVKNRLYQLTREHILYVRECMKNTTTRIYNMRAYTLTALFNAPVTMEQYYDSKVSHDMAENSWGSSQYGANWRSRSQREAELRNAECLRKYVWALHNLDED